MQDGKSMRWLGVITLFVLVAVSYIDRINIAVLITDASFLEHIGLDKADRVSQGLLATAFMVGYGISSIVLTPFAATVLGVRRSLIIGLLLWGGATFASPYFHSYGLLLASRFVLGVAEGPVFALASAYIKAYFSSEENGKPNSFVNMGTGLGLALGYPLVGYLLATQGWDSSFYALGILNIVLGVPLVLAFVKMPTHVNNASQAWSNGVSVGRIVRGALQTRHLLLITIMTAAFLSYLWGSSNWLPSYLKVARGFSLRDMGWLASLPQYATVVAVLIGGFVIDKMPRAKVPLMFVFCSIGVGLSVLTAIQVEDRYAATFALIAANFFWGLMSPAYPSMAQHFAKTEHIASAYGVINGVGSLVAGFMPTIMGGLIAGAATPRMGFLVGFGALIGTQVVVLACGLKLYVGERRVMAQPLPAH
ncbi:MFS transporter [Paucibacter sp. R3-3]|uniref:MFS transporter n=1 Tax=Roseateles agri TaxID=3098619 RepID=A0ABU5DP73_9BURK|nr:MFS transporter [Paucibacter sp. R3-3]MDY0748093.1 MFS transporter [Paucibacter sp. R3-3]